jgi:predicted TIM-barrel fold metal-dependent hydrolase
MEKTETLMRVADRMGIERLGLFLRPTNEKEIRDVLTHHRNRVFGFLWMTLWNETVDSHISALNRWVRDGPMVGMKIAGGDGVCSLAVYEPIYRYAGEIKAGIYIHTWLKVGGDPVIPGGRDVLHESKPQDVAALAAKHPDITFICGHTGGDWELGVRAVRPCKNVYVEIGGSYPTRGMVELAVKELGATRVIYGSDVSGRSYGSQLAKVYGAPISDSDRQLIFCTNLRRILTPIMRAKGMSVEG